MADKNLPGLLVLATLVFLIAPCFLLVYIIIYNQRKKRHHTEKVAMKLAFEEEIVKTQLEVQEQTMQTVGADLHDSIGQLLSLTALTLGSIELEDLGKIQNKIDAAIDLTGRSIKELRQLGRLLHGEQAIAAGLDKAINQEITWIERSGRYKVHYEYNTQPAGERDADKDLFVFRIVQEVLNNIIKHAEATEISIKLNYTALQMQLTIADNGRGFEPELLSPDKKGMGLHGMRKRASIIGGELKIISSPGNGSVLEIFIPYP